jgi:signal transduction histidine kinase
MTVESAANPALDRSPAGPRTRAEASLRFLLEASEVLAASLDYETTLASVARLVVPRLADWCSVYVVEPNGVPRQLAVAHVDPAKVEWARQLAQRYPPDPNAKTGIPQVLRSGESQLVREVTTEMLIAGARDADYLQIILSLGLKSVMIVPLKAHGQTLGAITFVSAESGFLYGPDDLALAEELARRAALAVDNARLYREARDALQRREEVVRHLGLLVEASASLTRSLDREDVLSAILDLAQRLLAADAYSIWRHRSDPHRWEIVRSAGLSAEYVQTAGRIVGDNQQMSGQPLALEDVQGTKLVEARQAWYRREGIAALLTVPLHIHGEVSGTLVFYYRQRHPFDELTIRLATALANLSASAIGIAELYERESALRRRAEEADRRKDEFLALLGHELRNPLAPLRNAVALLSLRPHDPLLVAQARDMIGRQTTQMTHLVEELLDASRIARGKIQLRREPLDLAALARAAAEDHRAELEAARLALAVETPPSSVWVLGDAARLTQVIENLLNNACKFTDPGGQVRVAVEAMDGEALLTVADSGIGFSGDALPRMFEAFAQVDAALERSKGGLGLGLSVVRGLIELHGGRVAAASDGLGRGAVFTVRLPLTEAPSSPPPPTEEKPTPQATRRRVLIIEDSRDGAESLRLLLSLRGFEVAVAHTGPDGVEQARRLPPHAVVCDLGLPGMSGFEVARRLRREDATASAQLICMSGYGQEQDRRQACEAGFDHFLVKPAEIAEVQRLLEYSDG